jgi:hypothetical protein
VLNAKIIGIDSVMRYVNSGYSNLVKAIAADLQNELRADTPVRSGRARAGWKTKVAKDNFVIENKVPYVGYLDKGTKYMPASNKGRGIVGPALTSIKGKYK